MTQITQMKIEKSVQRIFVQSLKYPAIENSNTGSEIQGRVQQLTQLARALASEIETLQRELRSQPGAVDHGATRAVSLVKT